jgi:hypothetical protein
MSAAPVTRRPLERTAEVIIRAEYPATHAGPRRPATFATTTDLDGATPVTIDGKFIVSASEV